MDYLLLTAIVAISAFLGGFAGFVIGWGSGFKEAGVQLRKDIRS
jgi:hypothetical protein